MRRPLNLVSLSHEFAVAHRLSLATVLASVVCVALLHAPARRTIQVSDQSRANSSPTVSMTSDLHAARSSGALAMQMLSVAMPELGLPELLSKGLSGSSSDAGDGAAPVAASSVVTGHVKYEGVLPKAKPVDMSKEPNCAKQYNTPPTTESAVGGPANALANVVVYISAGAPDEASSGHVSLTQYGCRYFPHVLAMQAKQEVWVRNEDAVSHTIHLMTKSNPELNKIQGPNAPEFAIANDKPEFIKVKCELHPWMRGVIAVLKNSYFAVTDADGSFKLPDLPPGKYTITVWHESFGTESRQIEVGGNDTKDVNFVLKVKAS
jgi:plastocyanin